MNVRGPRCHPSRPLEVEIACGLSDVPRGLPCLSPQVIPGVDRASALVLDDEKGVFRFCGTLDWDIEALSDIVMLPDEAHGRYISTAEEISPDTYVNIMGQYRPAWKVNGIKYSELNRPIRSEELTEAYRLARKTGLHRIDHRRKTLAGIWP